MFTTRCSSCYKRVNSSSGLTRHKLACPVLTRKALRAIPRSRSPGLFVNGEVETTSTCLKRKRANSLTSASPKRARCDSSDTEPTVPPQLDTAALVRQLICETPILKKFNDINRGLVEEEGDNTSLDEKADNDYVRITSNSTGSIKTFHTSASRSSGLHSTTTQSKKTYEEITGRTAGTPAYTSSRSKAALNQLNPKNIYAPFSNSLDYAWASLLFRLGLSKSEINECVKNPTLFQTIGDKIGIRSARSYECLMDSIPSGIKDDAFKKHTILVPSAQEDGEATSVTVWYRDVLECIRFLLGHPPFAPNLRYSPEQHFDENGDRMYHDIYTADWWFRAQGRLNEGATVVPLLLATDKTQLTIHHGDKAAWPVYLTIGNLDDSTRRSQTRPGNILLALIPILENRPDQPRIKNNIYHTSMAKILEPIEWAAKDGIIIQCADGKTRICHPIIAGIMADYEEQVLITGIKSNKHCPRCTVPPNERENLMGKWEQRTHKLTKELIAKSMFLDSRTDENWVHDTTNFAWSHYLMNIHSTMLVDILHQLHKGIVSHLIDWIGILLKDKTVLSTGRRIGNGPKKSVKDSSSLVQLDKRFSIVPPFSNLKLFPHYSSVKQWTGVEQKSIVRQLLPVVTPLLHRTSPAALLYIRAVMDFVTMAQYRSHTERTIGYMENALQRMNILADVFRSARRTKTEIKQQEDGNYNFPKYHALTHYAECIKEFGSAVGYDSAHGESAHRYQIKAFYSRTNNHTEWEMQLLKHNVRRMKLLAMDEQILLYTGATVSKLSERTTAAYTTTPITPINLSNWAELTKQQRDGEIINKWGLEDSKWRLASAIERWTKLDHMIDALAIFIIECRNKFDGLAERSRTMDKRPSKTRWAGNYVLKIHPSLKCWWEDGKLIDDEPNSVIVRCTPNWQKTPGKWRRDAVWILEHPEQDTANTYAEGKLIGQLLLIVTVLDTKRFGPDHRPMTWTGAFVDILRPRNKGEPDKIHGMVEFERPPETQRFLDRRRFYGLDYIIRNAHIVPAIYESKCDRWFLNNYVDFHQYNNVYDRGFEHNYLREAKKAARDLLKQTRNN